MPDQVTLHEADALSMAAKANSAMVECLSSGVSFRLEAGAGAGKTHALVEALHWLVKNQGADLLKQRRQIACITYTNVAVNEIIERLGPTNAVWTSTIHSFLWSLISPFQKALRVELEKDPKVQEKLGEDEDSLGTRRVGYDDVGRLRLREGEISVSHDHVLKLSVALLQQPKFRQVWLSRFPILLLDEYQDTNNDLMDAILEHMLEGDSPLQVGLFGDHWQRIYDGVCGLVEHPELEYIPKEANFRSTETIVDVLNRMRPELEQHVSQKMLTAGSLSEVVVWHTNGWTGPRGKQHLKNALNDEDQDLGVRLAQEELKSRGWPLDESSTCVLRLTNKAVAKSEGFGRLLDVFKYPESLLRLENPVIAFLDNHVEQAAQLLNEGRKTAALENLGWGTMLVKKQRDKVLAASWLKRLKESRKDGTVGDVIAMCEEKDLLPGSVERYLRRAAEPEPEGATGASSLPEEWENLSHVRYEVFLRWYDYESGNTMLSTKHGVKGAQYDEVIVVFGGGWSKYDFPRMLSEWDDTLTKEKDVDRFERARNLFYVTASRARYRLALLFLKTLEPPAVQKLEALFGANAVSELACPSE